MEERSLIKALLISVWKDQEKWVRGQIQEVCPPSRCDRPDLYLCPESKEREKRNMVESGRCEVLRCHPVWLYLCIFGFVYFCIYVFVCFQRRWARVADVRCGDATECDRPLGVSRSWDQQGQHDFRQFLQGKQPAELCSSSRGGKVTWREKLGGGQRLQNCSSCWTPVVSRMTARTAEKALNWCLQLLEKQTKKQLARCQWQHLD